MSITRHLCGLVGASDRPHRAIGRMNPWTFKSNSSAIYLLHGYWAQSTFPLGTPEVWMGMSSDWTHMLVNKQRTLGQRQDLICSSAQSQLLQGPIFPPCSRSNNNNKMICQHGSARCSYLLIYLQSKLVSHCILNVCGVMTKEALSVRHESLTPISKSLEQMPVLV